MDILILDSARKHGITDESIYSCLFNVRGDKILDDLANELAAPKHLMAGFDCYAKGTKYPETYTLPKQQPLGC